MNKIIFLTTWGVRCGIAQYSKYLFDELNKINGVSGKVHIHEMNNRERKYKLDKKHGVDSNDLVHIQHEFGIWPEHTPEIDGKLLITFHTISDFEKMRYTTRKFEKNYNVVGYIVHNEDSRANLDTKKDIWTISHGSTIIPRIYDGIDNNIDNNINNIDKEKIETRRRLGLDWIGEDRKKVGFVFGYQSGDKNYERLVNVARRVGVRLIISGAPRKEVKIDKSIFDNKKGKGKKHDKRKDDIIFVNRFLNEDEVNLYALASDFLLFDYAGKRHYSVSGAMHRVIGSGRPVICSDILHFGDIRNNAECLKFKDSSGLERKIRLLLENKDGSYDRLGVAAREYAEKTSWENVAERHLEIYRKYVNI